MSKLIKVGDKKSFADGALTSVIVNDQPVCIARAGETFYAFDDNCTHAHVMLSRGDIEGDEVVCPLHGARFSIKTGEALTPPAVRPVKTYDVTVDGDEVFIHDGPRPN